MATTCLILGESGTGKTASLRNLKPDQCLLIQTMRKALPFRAADWSYHENGHPGNIFCTRVAQQIVEAMEKTRRPLVVVDDFQYLLAAEFMACSAEKGYEKWTRIGKMGWDVLSAAANLASGKHIYVLCHSTVDDGGITRTKTIGKLLDNQIVPEGLVPMVLRTHVREGGYWFQTHNSGSDTVKTPIGMFEEDLIPNDLVVVDEAINAYYGTEGT